MTDYADQRYYNPWFGRFNTPDPSSHGNPVDPASWNKYSYVEGDPVNNYDPSGLYLCNPDFCTSQAPPVWFSWQAGPGGAGSGWAAKVIIEPPSWQDEWDNLSADCQNGLRGKFGGNAAVEVMVKAVNRAEANMGLLEAAADANGTDPALLAAIGVRETGFNDQLQLCPRGIAWGDPNCSGAGVFQIDLHAHPSVSKADALDNVIAANWVAALLSDNMQHLAAKFPNFTGAQLLQATAASYNLGKGGISGNPNTIDGGTTPDGKYGSNVMQLRDCFR